MSRTRLMVSLLTTAAITAASGVAAQAQTFAGKQVRMIIGSSAGGGYDLFARTISHHWPKHMY